MPKDLHKDAMKIVEKIKEIEKTEIESSSSYTKDNYDLQGHILIELFHTAFVGIEEKEITGKFKNKIDELAKIYLKS